ncbi:MAG: TetR/AcrR family transcriptional regulator [Polyangiales bacterium]
MPKTADGVRDHILASARTEFAEHGLEAASVHAIAERAGATAAMINYYFGGKSALHESVVAEAQARLLARISSAIESANDDDTLPAIVAGAYFDFLAEDRELQRILLREVLDRGDSVPGFAERFVRLLGELLEKHFGRGESVRQLAISLFGAVAGYFLYEPMISELVRDPLSPDSLRRRRRHVTKLAGAMSDLKKEIEG